MNVFEQENISFHGIGQNLLKYIGIMENGILTARNKNKSKTFIQTGIGYNRENFISFIKSPSKTGYFYAGGLNCWIKDNIAFGFLNEETNALSDSGIIDEFLIYGPIKSDRLKCILCKAELAQSKVKDLDLFDHIAPIAIIPTCNNIIMNLQQNDIKTDKLETVIQKYSNILSHDAHAIKERTVVNRLLGSKLQDLFDKQTEVKDCTVIDVLEKYNKLNLPIVTDVNNQLTVAEKKFEADKKAGKKTNNKYYTIKHESSF